MISHKHKCIFIHIAKCAGTTIEHAFGVDVNNYKVEDSNFLFGWDQKNKLWLQHATPQQLLDYGYINKDIWNEYYKFIVYRNSWDRAYSDYIWMQNAKNVNDTFGNFLNKEGEFKKILTDNSTILFAGDHLYLQKDYFFLNGKEIMYNTIIDFKNLNIGLNKVIQDLRLPNNFFSIYLNQSKTKRKSHYSKFYNFRTKRLVLKKYKVDIEYFNFEFDDKRNFLDKLKSFLI